MTKRKYIGICVLGAALLFGTASCGREQNGDASDLAQTENDGKTETADGVESGGHASRLLSLGNYKGLSYTDGSGREPTEAEVEEEMQAILAWFEDGELTDAWVQENLELASVDDFRENTKKSLREVYDAQAWKASAAELYGAVIAESTFELDETEVSTERNDYLYAYQQMAEAAGMSYAEFIPEATGMTVEQFETEAGASAEQVICVELVAEAIAEKEGLSVEDAYDETAAQIVEAEGFDSVEAFEREAGGKGDVAEEVRYRLVAQFLMEAGNAAPRTGEDTERK